MGFVVYPRSQQYIPGINCSFHRGSRMAETTFCPVTKIFQESVCRRVKRSQVMLCLLLAGSFTKFCPLETKHLQRMRENGSYTGLQLFTELADLSFLMQSHWFNEADCTHIILVSSYDITTNYIYIYIYYRIYLNKH